jgi:hypothetical protein
MVKILVSGNKSGLGKFLYEELTTDGFNRDDNIDTLLKGETFYDIIIHCAFNMKNNIGAKE